MILQKIYLYCIHTKLGSQSDLVDKAMWTDEASGVYTKYSSIAEEGTSLRRKSNANYRMGELLAKFFPRGYFFGVALIFFTITIDLSNSSKSLYL